MGRMTWWACVMVLAIGWPAGAAIGQADEKDSEVFPGAAIFPGAGAGVHPRLLTTPGELQALKAKALAEGNPFFAQLTGYLIAPPGPSPDGPPKWARNATEAQRQGLWRAPSVALHFALTGSAGSFDKAKGYLDRFLEQPQWEVGREDDSGMGAANIMIGAAIAYDFLYRELDPAYRERFRAKLLDQARKMYRLGHQQQNDDVHYWQQDPQNNHRWHRDAGLALAVLAAADPDDPADDRLLQKTKAELDFVHRWLPADGSNHEGPSYAAFGTSHLALAFRAADRVLGTDYLQHPFWANAADFRLATLTPGLDAVFAFGDASIGSLGAYNNYAFLAAAVHRQPDRQAGLMTLYRRNPKAFEFGWMSVLWHDPTLAGGSIENLPKLHVFEDLGFATVRDGWAAADVGLAFKCGPYGGRTLNEYRNAHDGRYINVAHDDPDANSFLIYARGQMLVKPDGYAHDKRTASHNTILVDGRGQKGEGKKWTQPLGGDDADMTRLARLTRHEQRADVTVFEGEAGGAYAGLDRYRRTVLFREGRYILILDDIRGTGGEPREITWLVQGDAVAAVDAAAGRFVLRSGEVSLPMTLVGDVDPATTIGKSPAEHRGQALGLAQLRAVATTARWRTAALFDAWGHGRLEITFIPVDERTAELHIRGPEFEDRWRWDVGGERTMIERIAKPEAGER